MAEDWVAEAEDWVVWSDPVNEVHAKRWMLAESYTHGSMYSTTKKSHSACKG